MSDTKEQQYTRGKIEGHPLWGALPLMTGDSIDFLEQCAEQGDIVSYRFFNQKYHGLQHPDFVKQVLLSQYEVFVKEGLYSRLDPVFRGGLLTAKGAFWKKQRRTIQPAFARKNLKNMVSTMHEVVGDFQGEMHQLAERGEAFDLFPKMLKLALSIINKTMFSNDVTSRHEEVAEHIYSLNRFLKKRNFSVFPTPVWIPTKSNRSFRRALLALDEIVMEIVDKRMKTGELGDDLLGMLLSSTDPETGERMSMAQVRAEAVTIFITGHETTATALTWAYYMLCKHPDVYDQVQDSIDLALATQDIQSMEGMLDELKFLDDVFLEAIRLRPPIYVTYRQASRDTEVCGYKIKKGESVHLSPYIMNRDPRYWSEPDVFKPSRFQDGEGSDKFVFFPFGAGPRSCIGSHFSMLEARIILATLGRTLRFELEDPSRALNVEPLVTLKPREPVMVFARKRD